jgi:hypothetical protein
MENMPGTTTTLLNKILIPVITTVLGATAIYFLGFNKKSGRSDMEKLLITKEATIKAWKSFVTTQNIANKNTKSLSDEYGEKIADEAKQNGFSKGLASIISDYKDEMIRESKKASKDIEDILKIDDIDEGFVSMMNRALDNNRDQEKKAGQVLDDLISIARSDLSAEEKAEKWKKQSEKIATMAEKIEERAANEAEAIAKTLTERYNQPFDLNELDVYVEYKKGKDKKTTDDDDVKPKVDDGTTPVNPNGGNEYVEPVDHNQGNVSNNTIEPTEELLTGEWDMTGGALELSANGTMYWSFDTKGYTSGKWKLVDGKLQMNATNPDTKKTSILIGFLSNVTRTSFTMTFMSTPKEVYHFKKSN